MQTILRLIRQSKTRTLALLALLSIFLFGIFELQSVIKSNSFKYNDLLELGMLSSTLMPIEDIRQLNGVPEDSTKPEYARLKSIVKATKWINERTKFAYLFVIRNNKMYFMVDSEMPGADDYSPPGQLYPEATPLDLTLMNEDAKPVLEKSTDRWGKWVSVLVPIRDPKTNKHIAVLGMDMSAYEWNDRNVHKVILSVLVVLVSFLAIIFIVIIMYKNRQLEMKIEKLKVAETELIVSNKMAEENNKLKTAFLKNISHEIRTPLNAIIGFAGLLDSKKLDINERELYLNHLVMSSKRMLNTITDIIDISRLQSGSTFVNKQKVVIKDCIDEVIQPYLTEAKDKNILLVTEFQPESPEAIIETDGRHLKNIFDKLLSNAFKFTTIGQIKIGFVHHLSETVFYVSDTGIGIDLSLHNYIFEDFRQVLESSTRTYDGNGLGLAIAKNLVELLGGEIQVESKVGEGSTFRFIIPNS